MCVEIILFFYVTMPSITQAFYDDAVSDIGSYYLYDIGWSWWIVEILLGGLSKQVMYRVLLDQIF